MAHIKKNSNIHMHVGYKICARANRRGFANTIRTYFKFNEWGLTVDLFTYIYNYSNVLFFYLHIMGIFRII